MSSFEQMQETLIRVEHTVVGTISTVHPSYTTMLAKVRESGCMYVLTLQLGIASVSAAWHTLTSRAAVKSKVTRFNLMFK
jgi:hypothetical protein